MADADLIALTADIVSAHVSNNSVATADLPELIRTVYAALGESGQPPAPEAPKQEPAVPIRSSVKPSYIVCLEDGKKLTMLKRYLRTSYGMTPEQYRTKWGLPADYPMSAPDYSEKRRSLAQAIGLGRKKVVEEASAVAGTVKRGARAAAKAVEAVLPAGDETPAPKKRGRPRKVQPAA